MFRSLRIQLGLIVFGLVLLVAASVATAFLVIATQVADARVTLVQLAFLAAALLLLMWGYFFTRRRLAQPLAALNQAARRIASGHLDRPVSIQGDDELAHLAGAFELMRAEVAAARDELESRVARRTRELTSAFEFSQEIIAHLDLDHLVRSVTERARALTGAEAASLCLLSKDNTTLVLAASSGDGAIPQSLRQPVWLFPASLTVGANRTVVAELACTQCGFLQAHAPGHCVATPLRVGERVLGELCVVRGGSACFDPDETRALALLANSAAIAIANARLVEAGRQQAEQAATLAERERLAAELHDHLAQTLGFLNLKIDHVKETLADGQTAQAGAELDRMKSAVGSAYRQVRAALVDLRDPVPSGGDLAEQLADCLADFRAASGQPVDLIITNASALALPRLVQTQALLIVREALINVRRHAQARRAWVRVERIDGQSVFTVEDDGRGFDPSPAEGNHHLGLAIMRTRAERSGGSLSIESVLGAGTKVIARFPLAPAAFVESSEPVGRRGVSQP